MKNVFLPVFALLSILFSNQLFAQGGCVGVDQSSIRITADPSDICVKTLSFSFSNPTNGARRLNVVVKSGETTLINDCYDASGQKDVVRTYTSSSFTACDMSTLGVIITPYNAATCSGIACAPIYFGMVNASLPVTFASFTANRVNTTVQLKWETATEINNKGFFVERNNGGTWTSVGFVNSKATDGNSNSLISYQYADMNGMKGVSQYRLKQVDLDGKVKYSDVRAVRSEDQAARTIVYPNPSNDGNITVVYASTTVKNITISDVTGRTLKQWNNYTSNTLQVANLNPGMYTIRSVSMESNEQSVEKIIVGKR